MDTFIDIWAQTFKNIDDYIKKKDHVKFVEDRL